MEVCATLSGNCNLKFAPNFDSNVLEGLPCAPNSFIGATAPSLKAAPHPDYRPQSGVWLEGLLRSSLYPLWLVGGPLN